MVQETVITQSSIITNKFIRVTFIYNCQLCINFPSFHLTVMYI